GYAGARRDLARALGREAHAGLAVAERDVAARAALAWIDARLAREIVHIRDESLKDAASLVQLAAARVGAGSASPGEEALARAVLGSARAEALDAEGRRVVADAALRYVTGLAPAQPLELAGPLDTRDPPLDARRLLSRAGAVHPDVELARATATRELRTSDVARAGGKPYLSVGPVVTREGTGDWLVQGRIAVPLPLVNPAALEASRARSEAGVAEADARRLEARLGGEIQMALHEREHARELREALLSGAITPAREALRVSERQYEAGSGELSTVLGARRALLDAEERWAEAAADVRRADVKLARALGREPNSMGAPNR
ncbi:MAG: TolC family protein, partial [Sorangiineae bacterium]|nr:TolC family protein [Sorangiineae bacterium]